MQPECSSPDYGNPECRVVAENDLARLRTAADIEVRFQEPQARSADSWSATGLLRELDPRSVHARVATPGAFALSLERGAEAAVDLHVVLDNVDPAAIVTVGELDVPAAAGSTRRELDVAFADDAPVWIRASRSCPSRFRVAFTADIQTNPLQFERIVERLREEQRAAEASGEPLVALVIAGDLAENSREDEFETVAEILARLPLPTAVVPGNHDVYRPLHPLYNRRFGPGNYAFTICDVHIAMLDTGSGAIARSVQARLPELLDRGDARHLVAVMHHPPYAGITGAGWSREDLASQTLAEFALAGVDLVVAGHAHALHDFPAVEVAGTGLHEVIVGTAGAYQGVGVPRYGYLRASFDGEQLRTCFVEVPPPGLDAPVAEPLRTLDYCAD